MSENISINSGAQNYSPKFSMEEFELATEIVKLPSKGIFYENGQDEVEIKYLTAEEEDILFSPELIKSGKVLEAVIQAGVVSTKTPLEQLLASDRTAILVALRRTGFGDDYPLEDVVCPHCEAESSEVNVNLGDFGFKEDNVVPDSDGLFSFIFPIRKFEIRFRLLNGEDERVLSELEETKKVAGMKIDKLVTQKYLRQIMDVKGNTDKAYIKQMISTMPLRDSLVLREYMKSCEPGLDMNVNVKCQSCGKSHEEQVVLNPVKLFYPKQG